MARPAPRAAAPEPREDRNERRQPRYTPPMPLPETPPILLWDDGHARLGPLTQTRPAARLRTGALTHEERLKTAGFQGFLTPSCAGEAGLREALERLDAPEAIVVAAAAVTAPGSLEGLAPGRRVADPETGRLVAARLPLEKIASLADPGALEGAEAASAPCLLSRPWDIIRRRDDALALDLSLLLTASDRWVREAPPRVTILGDHRVAIDPAADVLPTAVLDATAGPIVIAERATVRPGAIVKGPAFIGPGSAVLDHALIKENTALGPVCKVAGEVGGTIFQGHANKAHDGHLGDAWVGEWANLGAGTTNSNLLNTYSEISARAEPGAPRERTGLTFFGAVIGDHVKTAICTRLFTGTIIGTGAMIASTAPPDPCTPAFAWVTDAGVKTFRIEKFLEVARAAMSRREAELTPEAERALRDLHARVTAAAGAPA